MAKVHPADRLLVIKRLAEARNKKAKPDPAGWHRLKPAYQLIARYAGIEEDLGGYANLGEATAKVNSLDPGPYEGAVFQLTHNFNGKRWVLVEGRWELE